MLNSDLVNVDTLVYNADTKYEGERDREVIGSERGGTSLCLFRGTGRNKRSYSRTEGNFRAHPFSLSEGEETRRCQSLLVFRQARLAQFCELRVAFFVSHNFGSILRMNFAS